MRHTCATLLLLAGIPAHVVQKRLGHKRIEMTLSIYAHALPSMQQDAADRFGRSVITGVLLWGLIGASLRSRQA